MKKRRLFADHTDEISYAAVVSFFILSVKETCRQFAIVPMVAQAETALALSGTRFVGAVAGGFVIFDIAFHLRIEECTTILIF